MNVALVVVSVVVLLAFGGLLAAGETVLLRLSLVRALRLADDELKGSNQLLWLVEHRSTALNVILLGTVTARALLTGLLVVVFVDALGTVPGVATGVAVAVVASIVVSEVASRTLVLRRLEWAALALAPSFATAVRIVAPVAGVLVGVGRQLAGTRKDVSGPFPDDDELRRLVEAAEDADDPLEADERAMIRNVFELGDTVVREIMVPRPDMITVADDARLRDLVNTILRNGYSRIPVRSGESHDHIVGVVYAKDVLRQLALNPGNDAWGALIREPTYVPESKRVDDLLRELQEQTVHLAIVVDEYGAVSGLVTIEDILEEIVGEIVDEHDHEPPMIVERDDGLLDVDGRVSVEDMNDLLGVVLPHTDWDTVGGLVFTTLGYVPTVGEKVELEDIVIEVTRVQGRRIAQVLVTPPPPAEVEPDAEAADQATA